MGMLVTNTATTLSKQTDARVVRNPTMVTNAFTLTEESKAAETLKLKDPEKINDLNIFLKRYDFTSISTNELKEVGSMLYDNKLIDDNTFMMFIAGDGASDANGRQTKMDVKFNAIALFNEKLEDNLAYFKTDRYSKPEHVAYITHRMVSANQALNAMVYFVNSPASTLSIDEHA
ncbi:hypothetical protein [Pseudomonas sp. EL_65y_Pfl1_R83]|uniref:hypothetical protein n=1 Tax=Pseudomonas sp. EL_65y_Pfl1_R83 TaxID=3088697 RepID=UPI0030DA692C